MTETVKVLGQQKPPASTLTALYTVPAATSAVGSTLTVCEQGGMATSFRLSVAVAGAADSPEQYICFDVPLKPNETKTITVGLTLAATDLVRCSSPTGSVSFNLFGVENS